MSTDIMSDHGIRATLTEQQATEWARERWGSGWTVTTRLHPHPTSFGDTVAHIEARGATGTFAGRGYSGMAPWGYSVWWKAAADLMRWEPLGNVEG